MPSIVGRRLVRLGTVVSTMDEVEALARAGEPEGIVVVADEQTAGRGRSGRRWSAPTGSSLLCSILLRPPVPPDRLAVLPLVVGVAAAEAIDAVAGVACRLKWPNDVWIDGRKVAGVLVTARTGAAGLEHSVVGVGINVNVPPTEVIDGATSLLTATGHLHDRERLLTVLLERLGTGYQAFVVAGGRPDLRAWRSRSALVDERVTITVGDDHRHGTFRGVDDDGALLLEVDDRRVERVVAGELTRGPVRRADG